LLRASKVKPSQFAAGGICKPGAVLQTRRPHQTRVHNHTPVFFVNQIQI